MIHSIGLSGARTPSLQHHHRASENALMQLLGGERKIVDSRLNCINRAVSTFRLLEMVISFLKCPRLDLTLSAWMSID